MTAVSEILNQFERQFKTLDTLYGRVNDEAWTYPDQRVKGTWQWMAHLLETIEFYTSDKPAEQFPWGHRFGVDWENAQAEPVPDKEAMHAYQKDMGQFLRQVLGNKTDQDLAAPETIYPWTGQTCLGRLLYLMRHTQQHIGDINRGLRLNGCEAMEWH